MDIFEWNDSYKIGIPSIDKQHKTLVELSSKFHESVARGNSSIIVHQTFDQLIKYTESHLVYEEQLFDEYSYTEKDTHKIKHQSLSQQVRELRRLMESGGEFMLAIEIMAFLKEWLMQHILEYDKSYVPYLLSKGAK